jgi:hypothetical protein
VKNFVASKKGLTTNFFSTLPLVEVFGSGIRDLGSGMGKNQDQGSGINILDPQHCIEISHHTVGMDGWMRGA